MFIINPLSGERMDNLFSTHPSTDNRVAELEKFAQAMRQTPREEPRPAPRRAEPASEAPAGTRRGPWGPSTEEVEPAKAEPKPRSTPTITWGRGDRKPPEGPYS